MKLLTVSFILVVIVFCGCGKKNIENTEKYKELIRQQEETDKKLDSIKLQNYKQLNDSVNNNFQYKLDSLKRSTDSLEKELEKSIKILKNIK